MKNYLAGGILILILCVTILFVSISRAGFEITVKDVSEDNLRNLRIEYTSQTASGAMEPGIYKLPESRTLPGNPFYGLKNIRDWMWLNLGRDPISTAKLSLLLADKKITESIMLFNKGENILALITFKDALNKLKYADTLVDRIAGDQAKQIKTLIYRAGFAYEEVIKTKSSLFDTKDENYQETIKTIEEWNESQQKEKEKMAY